MFDLSQQMEVFPAAVDLKRIDPSVNMRRFYRMSVQPDLFGGTCLVREWGRIGFQGQIMVETHPDEGQAISALMKLAALKKRRGYVGQYEGGQTLSSIGSKAMNPGLIARSDHSCEL